MGFVKSAFGGGGGGSARRAVEAIEAVELPQLEQIALERLSEAGDPRDFLQRLQDTELRQVDPTTREAQIGALGQLQEIAQAGGLTEADLARLEDIGRQEATRERGQREAIQQQAAQRGISGSGLELAQTIAAQQGAADRGAQRGRDVAQMAQQRALDAVLSTGALGGQIRGQDLGVAEAQDLINRFNAQQVSQAGLQAFQNRQRIADTNVQLENQQRGQQNILNQQAFENQLRRQQALANASLRRAGVQQQAQQTGLSTLGSLGRSAAGGLSGAFGVGGGGS